MKRPVSPEIIQDGIKIANYIIKNKCALGVASQACFPNLSHYSTRKRFLSVQSIDKELYKLAREIQAKAAKEDVSKKAGIRLEISPEMPKPQPEPELVASRNRMAWLKRNIKPGQTVIYRIDYQNLARVEVTKTFQNYFYGKRKGRYEECFYYQQIVVKSEGNKHE